MLGRSLRVLRWGVLVVGLWPGLASAYPWMIKHGYAACGSCHGDPSGGGVLTPYGRAQDVLLATMPYRTPRTDEPGRAADFAWSVPLPEWLLATVAYRGGGLLTHIPGVGTAGRYVLMLLDARAQAQVGAFIANVSVGYGNSGLAQPAAVTRDPGSFLLSRTHWVGARFLDDAIVLRAGRIDVPFGLRNPEHTSWVRAQTSTDTNAAQQHGVSVFYGGERVRAEVMAIAGNFQLASDRLRERGYSGYVEVAVERRTAVGVSSRLTEARDDGGGSGPLVRQSHGVFARYAPGPLIALLAEVDVAVRKQLGRGPYAVSTVGWLQLDIEPTQGFHILPAAEVFQDAANPSGVAIGGWLTAQWMFAPHCELRVDGQYRTLPTPSGPQPALSLLGQVHIFL